MVDSGREIRNGLIATFISIANMLKTHDSEYVQEELGKYEKWDKFVEDTLEHANYNNEKALAGHQSKSGDSDEESANYETSMDKLFAVFTNLKESHDSSRELDDSDEEEEEDNKESITTILDRCKEQDTEEEKQAMKNKKEETVDEKEEIKQTEDIKDKNIDTQVEDKHKETEEKKQHIIFTKKPEEDIKEKDKFYDNSYWNLPSSFSIDELIQDNY